MDNDSATLQLLYIEAYANLTLCAQVIDFVRIDVVNDAQKLF